MSRREVYSSLPFAGIILFRLYGCILSLPTGSTPGLCRKCTPEKPEGGVTF